MRPVSSTALALSAFLIAGCSSGSDGGVRTGPAGSGPPAQEVRSTGSIVAPPAHGRFDYQIGGAYTPAAGVTIVDRDRGDEPAPGIYSICYVNAYQSQPENRSFWTTQHPDLLVTDGGKPVEDPDWPGEYLLDTSSAAHRSALAAIVGGWLDGCASSGFRAVEPDNLDSWTRSKKHLTQADNLAFAALLISRAHADGLAIAQKNTVEVADQGHRMGFDFAVAEECQVYGECGDYTHAYGDHVLEIEYTDNPRKYFTQACSARGGRISVILRDRDVVPAGHSGYHYETCGV